MRYLEPMKQSKNWANYDSIFLRQLWFRAVDALLSLAFVMHALHCPRAFALAQLASKYFQRCLHYRGEVICINIP
jgi:hypothetical protein